MNSLQIGESISQKAIICYVAIAYLFSIALSFFIGFTGGHTSPYIAFGFTSMFIPALSVWIVQITMHEGPMVDWKKFPLLYLPLAVMMIPFIMHVSMLPVTVAWEGSLNWQDWLSPQQDGLYHTSEERGWGILTHAQLIRHIVANALIGLVSVSFLAFFEEIGWRGWLLPKLAKRMGWRTAIFVTAIIWALWHVPYALSEILYVGRVPSIMTVSVTTFGTFSSGLIIGWFWFRTKSIWIVSIAHGALNNWGQYAFKYLDDFKVADPIQVLAVATVGLFISGIILLFFLMPRKRDHERAEKWV